MHAAPLFQDHDGKKKKPTNEKALILQKQLMQLSQNILGVNKSVLSK